MPQLFNEKPQAYSANRARSIAGLYQSKTDRKLTRNNQKLFYCKLFKNHYAYQICNFSKSSPGRSENNS